MLSEFELIRIINLPHRRDRRAQMMQQLEKVGLAGDDRVRFFDAIRPDDAGPFTSIGAHGVYRSQLAILEEAVAADRSVLIMEDDCDIAAAARSYRLPQPWDIFYGGYYAVDPADLHASDIIGAHMMGFSRAGARAVLRYLKGIRTDAIHPPIDAAYVWFRRAHPEVPTVFAVPPLGEQRASRSDIEPGAIYNRLPVVRTLVEFVRRLRHRPG